MNPDWPGTTRTRDSEIAWAEFTVGPNGVDDYEFTPHADEVPMIRVAFPLPTPSQTEWQTTGPRKPNGRRRGRTTRATHFSVIPGWSPAQSPWTILFTEENPFLKSWQATRHTMCDFDPKAGLVLKLETRTDFGSGPHIWTLSKATFEQDKTLAAADFAQIKQDSAELSGALAEFYHLWREADDPVHEADEFQRRVDASGKRFAALGAAIKSPEFFEDTNIIGPDQSHAMSARVQPIFAARQALLNKPSPDWTAQDLAGQAHALKDYRGKVVLLNFWDHWSTSNAQAVPMLNQLAKDYAVQPVAVIGVNPSDKPDRMRESLAQAPADYPQLQGLPVLRAHKLRALPGFLLIDQDGIVRFQHAGCDDSTAKTLRAEIDELLRAMHSN